MAKETEREEIKEETHELEDEEKDELEDEEDEEVDDEEAWNEITLFRLKCHRQIGIIMKGYDVMITAPKGISITGAQT